METPLIAVPLGDPAGIGPEIVAKAVIDEKVLARCRPLVVGDAAVMERALATCGLICTVRTIEAPRLGRYGTGDIQLIDLGNVELSTLRPGQAQADCGRAAYEFIERAVALALQGEVDALATTPINKESLRAAGVRHIGHTEILGELTGSPDPLTMFEVRGMRVFFLSRHVSLREACDLVTKERLLDYIARGIEALQRLGVSRGTLAVAGLNPHSGEHGLFGYEEVEHVEPAVREARQRGYDVEGPIGADSVFHLALQGRYAAVLSLYHDQGHIATKTYDFERTIAITNGLPFLRTSVDHGTAFDIAWSGRASAVSMIEAILLAAKYAPLFQRTAPA